MSNRKNNNSVILLTTLGVYLGLVLVGAAPQVLAQAAMTKQFNVRDEIEFKDNLDKKPDDDRTPVSVSVQGYLEDVEFFLGNLRRQRSRGNFDIDKDLFDVAQSTLLPCVDSNRTGRFTPIRFVTSNEVSRPALIQFSRSMVYGYSLGDCIDNNEFNGISAVDSRFNFKLAQTGFFVEIAIKKQSPQNAAALSREIDSSLRLYAARDNTTQRSRIIQATSLHTENDQVFIVTRLPRAGLDALLAIDAK